MPSRFMISAIAAPNFMTVSLPDAAEVVSACGG